MARILAVDDQKEIRESIKISLKPDHKVTTVESGEKCLDSLSRDEFDCVLLDLMMPGRGGIETLRDIAAQYPATPVVMLTATKDVRLVVEAMKIGAFDYLTKPADLEELRMAVKRAIEKGALERELNRLRAEIGKIYGLPNVVGKHPAMQEVYERVEMVAPRKSNVLIIGESGTGKELVARAIQQQGPLKDKPFVPVNCAAIPLNLVEDELFGHERGAFTDARTSREGCFEQANGGTLFLDEISELDTGSQAKLLRVLQEREFKRVGGSETINVEVRLIAATNKDLSKLVEEGAFRRDLFYRVHVVPLRIPPLRERKTDIPLLLGHFLRKISKREGIEPKEISPDAMEHLMNHKWPGNVRELENMAEQLMALVRGNRVEIEHLPGGVVEQDRSSMPLQEMVLNGQMSLPDAVEEFEIETIKRALILHEGNKTHAAKALGLTRRVLGYKMKSIDEIG